MVEDGRVIEDGRVTCSSAPSLQVAEKEWGIAHTLPQGFRNL